VEELAVTRAVELVRDEVCDEVCELVCELVCEGTSGKLLRRLIVVVAIAMGLSVQAAPERRPNFVFIFADDLGYGDLTCYGHPYAKTPTLDKLASEGTMFTQAYAAGQTCSPTGGLCVRRWCALPATPKKLPSPGELPRSGSVMELGPANLQLLALKPAEDGNGIVLRV